MHQLSKLFQALTLPCKGSTSPTSSSSSSSPLSLSLSLSLSVCNPLSNVDNIQNLPPFFTMSTTYRTFLPSCQYKELSFSSKHQSKNHLWNHSHQCLLMIIWESKHRTWFKVYQNLHFHCCWSQICSGCGCFTSSSSSLQVCANYDISCKAHTSLSISVAHKSALTASSSSSPPPSSRGVLTMESLLFVLVFNSWHCSKNSRIQGLDPRSKLLLQQKKSKQQWQRKICIESLQEKISSKAPSPTAIRGPSAALGLGFGASIPPRTATAGEHCSVLFCLSLWFCILLKNFFLVERSKEEAVDSSR